MNTSYIFLAAGGSFLILALVFLGTSKGSKKKEGTFDPEYVLKFNETYLLTGNIKKTLEQLEDGYEDNPYMKNLIGKALKYLNGDYGDYETALRMLENGEENTTKCHSEIIRLEIAKNRGIPENTSN